MVKESAAGLRSLFLLQLFNLMLNVLCYLLMLGHKAVHKQENVTFQHSAVAVFQCSGAVLGVPLDT